MSIGCCCCCCQSPLGHNTSCVNEASTPRGAHTKAAFDQSFSIHTHTPEAWGGSRGLQIWDAIRLPATPPLLKVMRPFSFSGGVLPRSLMVCSRVLLPCHFLQRAPPSARRRRERLTLTDRRTADSQHQETIGDLFPVVLRP